MKKCVFNKLNIGAIPTSFQDAFSIEDQILWLQKYLNNAITLLNQLKEEVDNIDINFDEIEERINSLSDELNLVKGRVLSLEENSATKEDLTSAINTLDESLKVLINQEYSILKNYVDTKDEHLQ